MNRCRFLLFITGIFFFSCSRAQVTKDLNVSDFEKQMKSPNAQVLDVRTPEEYKTGYIKNAILADWNNEEQFISKAGTLDKTRPVYLYCRSGGRSSKAAEWLTSNGFKEVYNLEGGILAWKKNGREVVEVKNE